MGIKVKRLPTLNIENKDYTINWENNAEQIKNLEAKADEIKDGAEKRTDVKSKLEYIRKSTGEVIDAILFPGAFADIMDTVGTPIGSGGYLALMLDVLKETKTIYDKQNAQIVSEFAKANERKKYKK